MVKYSDRLDRIFGALSDRTRRGLLARLSTQNAFSVSDLAAPFGMSLPAVIKHLDVLSDAGLVKRSKTGRVVACALDAMPMQQANAWLERYSRFWAESFDRLEAYLEDEKWTPQPPSSQASRSKSASTSRRRASTRRGRGPKNS